MNDHIHPTMRGFVNSLFQPQPKPAEPSEDELIAADLDYLKNREERERRRVDEAHELDLQQLRAKGIL